MNIQITGKTGVITLPPKCSVALAKELFALKASAEYELATKLVVDFKNASYIDSSTIGVLVTFAKEYREKNRLFAVTNLSDEIVELFSDTGLDLIFNIEKNDGIIDEAAVDIFEEGVEIRLDLDREVRGDVCILHLAGVMNHPVGSRYFKQQFLLSISDHRKILLDFDQLTFFDSLSISVLINMYKLLEKTGGSIRFCRTNYIVDDLFKTLNISNLIQVYETIESALENWE